MSTAAGGDELTVDQGMIDAFADVTGDHQWIHVDEDRARHESPFGTTIAHGFLTLSLLPRLAPPMSFELTGHGNATIFGVDAVRFVRPVPAGCQVRARHRLVGVRAFSAGTLLQSETQVGVVGVARARGPVSPQDALSGSPVTLRGDNRTITYTLWARARAVEAVAIALALSREQAEPTVGLNRPSVLSASEARGRAVWNFDATRRASSCAGT